MQRFFGLDLGDAETAVCVLDQDDKKDPRVVPVRNEKSMITAYARLRNQEILIGENACYHPDAISRKIRFKSRFLFDREAEKDIRFFAAGVLGELYQEEELTAGEDACFYIGCPAGWNRQDRERYRALFEKVGYPPVRIISESRAALVSACQSRHLQVGYDILSHPVLVVDIGSSTTDFAYIMEGKEVELQTAGEVKLGGGIMDELILEEAVRRNSRREKIRDIFSNSSAWKSYCEFAARKLKEKYFQDEEYWKDHDCMQVVTLFGDETIPLVLQMNEEMVNRLLHEGCPQLAGQSFHEVFLSSLQSTRNRIKGALPEIVFLTGGVSRLSRVADWCREVYPQAVVITGSEPEFAVARGLAWCGRIDDQLKSFSREVENLRDSDIVERIVAGRIDKLYKAAVDIMARPIIEEAVLPVIEQWKNGQIDRLSEINTQMEKEITAYLHTEEARKLLLKPVASWLKPVAYELEKYTVPICVKHNIPYRALSLNSYLSLSEIEIHVDARNVFAVNEITWMIDTIITIVVSLLCGGSGVALIAQGLPGIIAGTVISLMVLFLGKDKLQGVLMKTNIPVPVRRLMGTGYMESRMDKITEEVKENIYASLEEEKDDEITRHLVDEISSQIDECLIRMAKIVEIPLGG